MKKYPRWAALLAALTIVLASTLAPLEGEAAEPIKLWDDPRELLGDPDSPPYSVIGHLHQVYVDFMVRLALVISSSRESSPHSLATSLER